MSIQSNAKTRLKLRLPQVLRRSCSTDAKQELRAPARGKSRPSLLRRGALWARRVWRSSWYRFGRGKFMRHLVRGLLWHIPRAAGTFTTSTQLSALVPVYLKTDVDYGGTPVGLNLWTSQPVAQSPMELYRAGAITSPNVAILGGLGTGKSTLVKSMLAVSVMRGGRGVVFDRKRQAQAGEARGEYTKLSQVVGGTTIRFHQSRALGTRINVLDPRITHVSGGGDEALLGQDRLLIMLAEAAMGAPLTPQQHYALTSAHQAAVEAAEAAGRVPVLADVIDQLGTARPSMRFGIDTGQVLEWGQPVILALLRYIEGDLAGLFDGETSGPGGEEVSFDSPLLVFDTSALEYGSIALGLAMAVTVAFLLSVWVNVPGEKSVVVEETYSAEGIGVVPEMLRDLAKRTRGVGASMISVFHHVSDIAPDSPLASLLKEAEFMCVFRQDKAEDATAAIELCGLNPEMKNMIMGLERGIHVRRIGSSHQPLIVEPILTDLLRYVTFTDDAFTEE